MSKRAIFLLVAGTIVAAAMIVPPLMLWGDRPGSAASDARDADLPGDVIVYCAAVPEGMHFGNLAPALVELNARCEVGSAVAVTPVYGESVIIARNAAQWRTVPPGAVFFLDTAAHRAEAFLDQQEFGLFVTRHPELARAGARAIGLETFLRALFGKNDATNKEPL